MSNLRVARRYAEALMESATDPHQLDRLASDLAFVQEAIKQSRELATFLKSPVISKDKKKAIFAELFRSRVSDATLSFLNLLTAKGREDVLADVIAEFFRMREEKLGIVTVEVRAATELTQEQHQDIQRRFEGFTQKKVRISFSLDKQLRGGFVARVGDTVFDGSVQRQLELLRERFAEETGRK